MNLNTKSLQAAVGALKSCISGRTTPPVLGCVKLEHDSNGEMGLTATNLDQWQHERIPCAEAFDAFCLNYRLLCSAIQTDEESIALSVKNGTATVKSSVSKFDLKTLPADEFPALPDDGSVLQGIPCEDLVEGIQLVKGFSGTDMERFTLCSVHILCDGKTMLIEASNSSNAAFYEKPLICPKLEMLVPSVCVSELMEALQRPGARLFLSEKAVTVKHDAGWFQCKQIEGRFPNTATIKNAKMIPLGELVTAPLKQALESCRVLIQPNLTPRLALGFSKSGLAIEFIGLTGSLESVIPGVFKPEDCFVNLESFLKMVSAMPEKCVISKRHPDCEAGDFLALRAGDLMIVSSNLRPK